MPPPSSLLEPLAQVFPGLSDLAGRLAPYSIEEYQRIGGWYLARCADTGKRLCQSHDLMGSMCYHDVSTGNRQPCVWLCW